MGSEEKNREQQKQQATVKAEQHPQYRRITPTGIIAIIREGKLEADIYTEGADFQGILGTAPFDYSKLGYKRILECRLVLDLASLKVFSEFLQNQLKQLEALQAKAASGQKQQPTGVSGTATTMTGGVG